MILQLKREYFEQIIYTFDKALYKEYFGTKKPEEKRVDYRDLCDYYIDCFCIEKPVKGGKDGDFDIRQDIKEVTFKNGYKKDAPEFTVEIEKIAFEEWLDQYGKPTNEFTFVLYINKIVSHKNLQRFYNKLIATQA